jgi:hypothetical protein
MEIEALTPYTHRIRFALNGKHRTVERPIIAAELAQ